MSKYEVMQITEITSRYDPSDPDHDHDVALQQTGFWGRAGAGCIFLAKDTRRIGIVHRSAAVEQPNTHGTVGGAIDPREDPKGAVIRETDEEVGYQLQPGDYLVDLDEFESGTFKYTTFLYVVETEFVARLNWEASGFGWFDFGNWPAPLHFGLSATLQKPNCLATIQTEIGKYRQGQVA